MKNNKSWVTCDRCGKEIKQKLAPSITYPFLISRNISMKKTEFEDIVGWKDYQINKITKEIYEQRIELSVIKSGKQTELDLCDKCSVEFDKFMKNE